MNNEHPKTWKEWAIWTSTEMDRVKEDIKAQNKRYEDLLDKHFTLDKSFTRLEARIYAIVSFLVVLIEIVARVI